MHVWLHKHRQCFECTRIQNTQLEIQISPCNRFNDTEIHCIDDYYRTKPSYPEDRGRCQRCTSCPFPKRRCQKFSDTVCCPHENYDVFVNKDGKPECVQLCGGGQVLDPETDQCLPCPQNTYMHLERHAHIYCQNCEVPRSKQEVKTRPCNSTHPAIIGCIDGCYRRPSLIYPFHRCAKCQDCSEHTLGNEFEGRACNQPHDSVCCPQPEMFVADTPEGPECIPPNTPTIVTSTAPTDTQNLVLVSVKLCGKGEYLTFDFVQQSATCRPCPAGTCMEDANHTRTVCHTCVHSAHTEEFVSSCGSQFDLVISIIPIVFSVSVLSTDV